MPKTKFDTFDQDAGVDFCETFSTMAGRAERIQKIKSGKRRYNAIVKLSEEWKQISEKWLFYRTDNAEILNAYTGLDHISAKDMDTYFADFADCLYAHTDRMFFNVWIRCQLALSNALEKGYHDYVQVPRAEAEAKAQKKAKKNGGGDGTD